MQWAAEAFRTRGLAVWKGARHSKRTTGEGGVEEKREREKKKDIMRTQRSIKLPGKHQH